MQTIVRRPWLCFRRRFRRGMLWAGAIGWTVVPGMATAESDIAAAQAVVSSASAIEREIARLTAPATAAREAASAREAELMDFPAWEQVRVLDEWLRGIEEMRRAGNMAGAYERALSESTRWYARQVRQVAAAMPVKVLGPIGTERFTDREYVAPRPVAGALDEPYLGEFETAPTNNSYALSSGARAYHRLARTLDPWQARDELAAAGMEIPLRRGWLVGGRLDFEEVTDAPEDAWAVYYAWAEVYSPTRRGMTVDLNTEAPCLYFWRDSMLYIARRCPDQTSPESGITLRGGGLRFVEGWNRIFIKILMRPGDALHLRFLHHPPHAGAMDDLRYRTP